MPSHHFEEIITDGRVYSCGEDEKFLLIFVIFKLKLIRGKCIIFVGDIDRCYRLKLYLEQFGIKACVLNSELPVNSRVHVVEEFNKNIYEIIIAADEPNMAANTEKHSRGDNDGYRGNSQKTGLSEPQRGSESRNYSNRSNAATRHSNEEGSGSSKKRKQNRRDKDYGVSRGIDFKDVACVLNFDLPMSPTAYTHRIGRTARAGNTGMALSFVVPQELYRKHKPTSFPTTKDDEVILDLIVNDQHAKGREVTPYQFDMKQVIAFRYRMEDALRAVTRLAIREARTREIKQELLKSEKLKRHFEENPRDLRQLRHDNELRTARIQSHLKHIPDYLLPQSTADGSILAPAEEAGTGNTLESLAKPVNTTEGIKKARMSLALRRRKRGDNERRSKKGRHPSSGPSKGRKFDPLKSFKP